MEAWGDSLLRFQYFSLSILHPHLHPTGSASLGFVKGGLFPLKKELNCLLPREVIVASHTSSDSTSSCSESLLVAQV